MKVYNHPTGNSSRVIPRKSLKHNQLMKFSLGRLKKWYFGFQRPSPCKLIRCKKHLFSIGISCTRQKRRGAGRGYWICILELTVWCSPPALDKTCHEAGEENNFMIKKGLKIVGNWKSIYLSINDESMSDTSVDIWSMLLFPLSDWMLIESPFFETRAYELISNAAP